MFCYNFHHTNRSLRLKLSDGTFVQRTPAMIAGLTVAPLATSDILTIQLPGFIPNSKPTLSDFRMGPADGSAR